MPGRVYRSRRWRRLGRALLWACGGTLRAVAGLVLLVLAVLAGAVFSVGAFYLQDRVW
jgi:hypothetical protein